MGEVTQSVDVKANLQTVYNQWTQFEEFPRFMEGVTRVEQVDDRRLRWTVEFAGVEREFYTKITEQNPDERIAWKSTSGVDQAGVVTFHRLGDQDTRVTLQMKFDPEGFVEHAGDKLGFVATRTKGDLERFKEFIEERQVETRGWRGEIDRKEGVDDGESPDDPDDGSDDGLIDGELVGGDVGEARIWADTEGVEEFGDQESPTPEDYNEGMRRYGG
jgi:ribosome-associated toxin RatA of RatAB toxin-antitoxin module